MLCIPNNDIDDNDSRAWNDFCTWNKWTTEQINMIEESHRQRLSHMANEGTIDLTPQDSQLLYSLLKQNRGSKESIKALRLWIIDRSHSIIAIGFILSIYIRNQIDPNTATRECTTFIENGFNSHQPFTHMLHTIYLINDIFFNCTSATMKGPYTKIVPKLFDQPVNVINHLFTQLPLIFYTTYKMARNHGEQDKIRKIVTIWVNKRYIDETRANILNSVMKQEAINIPEPGMLPLISPFPLNLPPPNTVTTPIFPVPPIYQPSIDLHNVSVGNMANVLKNAFRGGHLRYNPIDTKSAPIFLPQAQQMEQARQDARVQEFYASVDKIFGRNNDNESDVHRGLGHK